jgi:hypothetical protein
MVTEVTLLGTWCYWRRDVDLQLRSRKQMPVYGMEISDIASGGKNPTIGGGGDVDN